MGSFVQVIFIFALVIVATVGQYCDSKLCNSGGWTQNHIGCGNTGQFYNTCPSDRHLLQLTQAQKSYIVDYHNTARNKIASGGLQGYCPASRMATVTWNDELAYLASLNVLQCEMRHDNCRNTYNFKYSGQNLAFRGRTWEFESVEGVMKSSLDYWFNEYKWTNQNTINNCCDNIHLIGHFTQMVYDRAHQVGCAFSRYTRNGYHTGLFACNYSSGNIIGYKIYKCGAPASKCLNGNNPFYRSLCHPSEYINPNAIY